VRLFVLLLEYTLTKLFDSYNTHQFFLSDRSIYMVGFNLEDEDETKSIARVEYWLQSINTRLPGVPIVVFGTHMEAKKCTKEYLKAWEKKLTTRYKKKFRVVENCFISNDTSKVRQLEMMMMMMLRSNC